MNIDEFKQLFHRPINLNTNSHSQNNVATKPAAVLVCLIPPLDNLHIVLTVRALHLTHHAGQISFPGGKFEEDDRDLMTTALRETREEIGILEANVDVVGTLPVYNTTSGFQILPVVGLVKEKPSFTIDHNEVSELFTAPLSYFLTSKNYAFYEVHSNGMPVNINFIQYTDKLIWGATAEILAQLKGLLT